jgi:hypothetical protein
MSHWSRRSLTEVQHGTGHRPMNELAMIFGGVSGACLLAIAIRHRVPLFGALISEKIEVDLDRTDRRLAAVSALSFVACALALISAR